VRRPALSRNTPPGSDGQAAAAAAAALPGTPPSRWGTALPDRSRALRVTSSVLLLGALAGFALSMVQLFLYFGSGTVIANNPLLLNFGSGTGIANYAFPDCAVGGWALLLGGAYPTPGTTCYPNLGPQPLAIAAAAIILLLLLVNILGLWGRRTITAAACLVAVALLAISTLGLSAAFGTQPDLGPIFSQSGPDIGFWVVAGLLLAVALINSPPGRWAARDGRRILGPFGWRGP
jgi:hypothetical protein